MAKIRIESASDNGDGKMKVGIRLFDDSMEFFIFSPEEIKDNTVKVLAVNYFLPRIMVTFDRMSLTNKTKFFLNPLKVE